MVEDQTLVDPSAVGNDPSAGTCIAVILEGFDGGVDELPAGRLAPDPPTVVLFRGIGLAHEHLQVERMLNYCTADVSGYGKGAGARQFATGKHLSPDSAEPAFGYTLGAASLLLG